MEKNKKSNESSISPGASDMTRRMVCGGLAGMIAKTATAPLERIKILSQTGEHGAQTVKNGNGKLASSRSSIFDIFRVIIRNEGMIGLWAGNGANLLRIFPAKGILFSSNDFYRSNIRILLNIPEDQKLTGGLSFLAGGLSGMTASAVTYPLDFARGRISGKISAKEFGGKQYKGIWNTLYRSAKEEGMMSIYKGITPTLLGAMPYEGIKFGTVGLLEKWFPGKEGERPPIWRKLLFGGLGGVMAGIITYPNDTVRRLLQLQGSEGTTHVFKGYWDCVIKTYQREGIQRFFHGVGVNVIRMGPNTAVQFGSYEILKRFSDFV